MAINCHKCLSFVVLWRQQIIALAINCHECFSLVVLWNGVIVPARNQGDSRDYQRYERDGARFEHSTSIFFFFSFWGWFWAIFPTFSADFRCRISRGGMLQYRVSLYNKNDRSETVVTVRSRVTVSGSAGSHRDYCMCFLINLSHVWTRHTS